MLKLKIEIFFIKTNLLGRFGAGARLARGPLVLGGGAVRVGTARRPCLVRGAAVLSVWVGGRVLALVATVVPGAARLRDKRTVI